MTAERIGFIGLGAMGLPMARNLMKRGYSLAVAVNRSRKPVDELVRLGAVELASTDEVIAGSDLICAILPADAEMEAVLLSDRALAAIRPGQTLIEMTSGTPSMMERVAEAWQARGAQVLDAPVSGGTVGAEQGTLTVMAGGDPDVLDRVRPVLDAMARKIYRVGGIGSGKAIKAINQMLAAIHMMAAAEAAALAEKLGIDASILKEVIGASSGASWMMANKLDGLLKEQFEPGFKLDLMKKDIRIAVSEAGDDLRLELARFVLDAYEQASVRYGELDFSAISKRIKED
jgi:3-hydroxyisobutyrate dehydrogenase-like beta-hydroxyacid dehydrogenase